MYRGLFAFVLLLILQSSLSCKKGDTAPVTPVVVVDSFQLVQTSGLTYVAKGDSIFKGGMNGSWRGVNALHTFGVGNAAEYRALDDWKVKIVREFIGNLREQPITGAVVFTSIGQYLHPLQTVVDSNRAHGLITILCPFGWVDFNKTTYEFTGLNPSQQVFYAEYKSKMQLLAEQFKNQPDVWIEIWNEPYRWDNGNNYSHELWFSDVMDMTRNLRLVSGFTNIILVPGNEQGQSENAILAKGADLLKYRNNIVFDLHAYEQWLLNSTIAQVENRIKTLRTNHFPILFGETSVVNVSGLMPISPFLDVVKRENISTMAWVWKRDSTDQHALMGASGAPNNTNNNNWGDTFKQFLSN